VALPNDYTAQACSLEITGERRTLLIIRDGFWGVRRSADFTDHLKIPRAVLAGRLKTLTAAGVLTPVPGEHHLEYQLTAKGTALTTPHQLLEPLRAATAPPAPDRIKQAGGGVGVSERWPTRHLVVHTSCPRRKDPDRSRR
jgi:DNA-binding HxlR family transcriptional regulator